MTKYAFLFPGQGAQYPGMGKDFAESFAIARQTFEEADELLGMHLSKIVFEGPEALLTLTKNSQLGIFVTSIALLRTLEQQIPDIKPSICSGLSLGEYSALFASHRLGFKETLLLVNERARLMNEACENTAGTMAAVLSLGEAEVVSAIKGITGVWVANYNCPGQIVISGTKEGVEKASIQLKEKGAKRVLPLTVHGAFHSGLMQSAKEQLAPFIANAPIQESGIGFVMNVPGDFVEKTTDVRRYLAEQVTSSVRWEQGVLKMEGVDVFLEIGCGKTLTGLNRKIGVTGQSLSLDKVEDLEKIAQQRGAACNS